MIKPNNEELSQLLGYEVTTDLDQLKEVLQSDLFKGIEWVIVSLGADGAFAKHGDVFYKVDIPKLKWLIQWDLVIRQLLGLPQLSIIRKTTKHF